MSIPSLFLTPYCRTQQFSHSLWSEDGVAIAVAGVIHHHARSLHQRITDGRPDKGEAGLFQPLTHRFGLWGNRRDFAAILEMIDFRHPADERPEEFHRVFQRHPGLGVAPGGSEFQAVADDPGIEHQLVDLCIAHLRHALHIEAEQNLAITLALLQDGDPGQAGLEPFEQ